MGYYKKMISDRIYLSPIDADDTETYLKWMNDENVAKNYSQYASLVSSKNDLQWLLEPSHGIQRYAIVLLEGDVMIGCVSIQNIDHLNRNAFISIFIGEEQYRCKGYGTEAVRLILTYGFKTLNLHNIMLSVNANNWEAIACYKKVGFREVGRRRDWVFQNGIYIDRIFMDMLESEFEDKPSKA